MTGTSPPCLLLPRHTCRLCYHSVILCSVRTWKPTGTYRAVHPLQAGLHADAPSLWPFKLLGTLTVTGPFRSQIPPHLSRLLPSPWNTLKKWVQRPSFWNSPSSSHINFPLSLPTYTPSPEEPSSGDPRTA